MATESVVSPVMMNRPVVDPKTGSLTQYGYSLFSKLLARTGGTVGNVVDVPGLEDGIESVRDEVALLPIPQAAPQASEPVIGVESVMSELAALRKMVERLQQGYQL